MSTRRWAFGAWVFVALLAFLQTILEAGERATSDVNLARQGGRLSAEEAQTLEKQLEANPDDLVSRAQLLGYYWSKRDLEARQKHVLWIIENRPEAAIADSPYALLDPYIDVQVYPTAKAAWLRQTEKFQEDARVLGNAATFFLIHDREQARSFLEKAQSIEPDNPHWAERLGQLYRLETQSARNSEEKQEAAATALKYFEAALEATKQEVKRVYLLVDAARMSFAAGETEKAESYATELLSTSSQGNAVHHGNLILGRLALKSGDIDKAKEYLIAAGKTPGGPTLNSFGPNMALAKDLLEKGESEVVLEYFELCSHFWMDRQGRLKQWTKEVKNGVVPDFGASLVY